jgi:two-component system cell cycle sensor histidine kinase/response regulator CckA
VLWMHDRHGMITLSEGAALSGLGFGPGQLVGQSAFDLYRDQPQILANIRRVLAGESLTEMTVLGSVSLQSHLAPIRGPDGEIEGLIGVATDVSESRRLEEHLYQSQKMEALGRLSGGIAHDFNNLLGVIQGFAWLNERRFKPGEPGRQDMQQILAACERGAALNRQLLALGRRQKLTLQVVDVKKLIGEVEKILRRVVGEDVELRTRLASDLGHIKADVGQLERVLINLVVNAREAMPAGGSLTIEADNREVSEGQTADVGVAPGRYVALAVIDTGVGMDADTRTRMFEPFFSTKGTGQHTGLGLATVYGIIQQSHGHITVASERGKGTTIRIYLPRTDSAPVPAAGPTAAPRFPPRSETVLLVEDDTLLLSLLSEVLRQAGYKVLEASNAGEALLACEQHTGEIHLLLSDVVLPRLNGLELAARVRRQHPKLRVAFMSGYADETIARYGSPLPGDILIEKPVAPEVLLARLRDLLDGTRV